MIIVMRVRVYDVAGVVLEDHVAKTMRGLLGWRAAARSVWREQGGRVETRVDYLGARS